MEKTYTIEFSIDKDGMLRMSRNVSENMDGITMLGLLEMERQSVHRLMTSPEQEANDGK